jgi:hypothetical protein
MPRVALLLSAAAVAADLLPAGPRSGGDYTIVYTGRDVYVYHNLLDRAQLQLDEQEREMLAQRRVVISSLHCTQAHGPHGC